MSMKVIYWHLVVIANNFAERSIREFQAQTGKIYNKPTVLTHVGALLAIGGLLWAIGAIVYGGYRLYVENVSFTPARPDSQISATRPEPANANENSLTPLDGFSKVMLLGRWEGKWDGIWSVTLIVKHIEEQSVLVDYEVEDVVGGPIFSKTLKCKLVDVRDFLCEKGGGIGFEMDSKDTKKATAKVFTSTGSIRTAILTKVAGP